MDLLKGDLRSGIFKTWICKTRVENLKCLQIEYDFHLSLCCNLGRNVLGFSQVLNGVQSVICFTN